MADEAFISVLMPVRNGERFIAEAARSVLDQRGAALELVVVDDGSVDRSRERVQALGDPRVRIVDGPCRGIAAALNAGLAAAAGTFVCRCDADDRMEPGRLERQATFLGARRELAAVCGQFCSMTESGRALAEMDCGARAEEITGELRRGCVRTSLCTFLVRAGVARELGFREAFTTAEDIDFALRLSEVGRVWFEPRVEYHYRLHGESITHRHPSAARLHYEERARALQTERLRCGSDALMRGGELDPPPLIGGPGESPREQAIGVLLGAAWRHRREGRHWRALRTGVRACARYPSELGCWRSLGAMVLKREAEGPGGAAETGG